MEKRMNKEELVKLIESLKLDKNEYWILSSGALVLRGIYPDAGDLDIAVTEKGLKELKGNYNLKKKKIRLVILLMINWMCSWYKRSLENRKNMESIIYRVLKSIMNF